MQDEASGQCFHHCLHRVDAQEDVPAAPRTQRQQDKAWGGGGERESKALRTQAGYTFLHDKVTKYSMLM